MRKPRLTIACLTMLATCLTPPLLAQDDEAEPIFSTGKKPFVYVSAPSMNHLKDKLNYVFDSVGEPETVDNMLQWLSDNANGLEGLDWDRPAGAMLFLNSIYPPSIELVGVLPVSDQDQFQAMMELGQSVMREKRDSANEGHYELITPRKNYQIRMQNGYAYLQSDAMNPDPAFERDLPDAAPMFASLNSQFDFGITLDVDAIPKATRNLIMNFLVSTMSTQMQQRDEEPDSSYELRRSWGQADIDALKVFFDECRQMSFGLRVNPENREANIDFVMEVNDSGDLIQEILASSSKPSYFGPILSEESPVSVSWSALLAQRDIDRYVSSLTALKPEAARLIEENNFGEIPAEGSPMFIAIDSLIETAEEGHADLFGQLYNDSNEKLAVVGAMRVKDGEGLGIGLGDLLQRILSLDDFPADDVELTIGANEHNGTTFHRIEMKKPDADLKEIFGSAPGLSIGCSGRTVWICFGGEDSFGTLTSVIKQLETAYENPTQSYSSSPMRVIVQVNELVQLGKAASAAEDDAKAEAKAAATEKDAKANTIPDERTRRVSQWRQRRDANNAIMAEELEAGDDQIRMDVRPTDKGVRMRLNFQEAFIRGIGRMVASRINQSND